MDPTQMKYLRSLELDETLSEAVQRMSVQTPASTFEKSVYTVPKYHLCKMLNQLIDEENVKRAEKVQVNPIFIQRLREHGAPFETNPIKFTKNDVLFVIDMQNDFVPADAFVEGCGCFAVSGGERVSLDCAQLIEAASKAEATIIASRDYHPIGHCSFNTHDPKGPFPPHCVQGSAGSFFVHPVKKALEAARKRDAKNVHIVFKGYHDEIDSFGAIPYSKEYAEGRLSKSQTCSIDWTGASIFPCSNQDNDLDAPPDVLAVTHRHKTGIATVIPDPKRRLFICGLALDYCVLDTAVNARTCPTPHENVFIVADAAGAAFIPGIGQFDGGYLTDPAHMAGLLKSHKISLVKMDSLLKA